MKIISYIIGIIVTLAGIVGFFSESILGMLDTSTIQNIVYIVLGLLLLMAVKKGKALLTKIIGIIFAVLGILGLIMSSENVLAIVQNTNTGNYFHLVIGVILIIIAFMSCKKGSHGGGHSAPVQPEMTHNEPTQGEAPQQHNDSQM
jgi:uncharacterized membrane protein HdeD (DUF308 family)